MNIFTKKEGLIYKELFQDDFSNEKEIQKICESNLESMFGYMLIESEFYVGGFRIDTLAYDLENNSFVIIEYKNRKSFSVIDQGYTYLSIMLNNKSEFLLKFIEKTSDFSSKDDINWNQSKVIFVSPNFNKFQLEAINFKDIPFELWEIQKFNGDLVTLNQLTDIFKANLSVTTLDEISEEKAKINEEIVVFSEESHLESKPEEIIEIYEAIKSSLMELSSSIKVKANQRYLAFNNRNVNFCNIVVTSSYLRVIIKLEEKELEDGKRLFDKKNMVGGYAQGNYEALVGSLEDIEYIISCIKQAFNESKNTKVKKKDINSEKQFTEESHLLESNEEVLRIYHEIKSYVMNEIQNTSMSVTKNYIGFSNESKGFLYLVPKKKNLRVYLFKENALSDPNRLFRQVSRTGGYAPGNYDVVLRRYNEKEITYIFDRINEVSQSK